MTAPLTQYRDIPIWGSFLITRRNDEGLEIPVYAEASLPHITEFLELIDDYNDAGRMTVYIVSGDDFGSENITEFVAADMVDDWADRKGYDDEANGYDFPKFCQAHADDVIQQTITDGIQYAQDLVDQRAARDDLLGSDDRVGR